jgi:hypothetical protein
MSPGVSIMFSGITLNVPLPSIANSSSTPTSATYAKPYYEASQIAFPPAPAEPIIARPPEPSSANVSVVAAHVA